MKVRFSETALRETDEIFAYLYERNPSAAAAVVDRVNRVAALLEQAPFAGHKADEPGVRIMPLVRYPFVVFYTVSDDDEVVILHVRHGARRRPWEERR
jgi:plasmid stabilization system protein ParE